MSTAVSTGYSNFGILVFEICTVVHVPSKVNLADLFTKV